MRYLPVLLALLCLLLAGPARAETPLDPATVKALEAALDKGLSKCITPGVMVGVWQPGRQPWKAVRGVADVSTRRPVTLHSSSRVGSVTKTFTVTLFLQLVDEGRLGLDDKLSKWFPKMQNADRVTLRMLANMSSGLPSYTKDEAWVDEYFTHPTRPWTPEQLVAEAAKLKPSFQPGDKQFEYSNTNTVLLGLILEKVTGKRFPQLLQEKILTPLGLAHTAYPPDARLPEPFLRGYTVQGVVDGLLQDATDWTPTFGGPAGQMYSTLDDLAVWSRALGSGSLLKPATQKTRLEPTPAHAGGERYYAMGLGYDHGWLAHEGELPGYNAIVTFHPATGTVIVVAANSDIPMNGHSTASGLFRALAEVMTPDSIPGGKD